MSEKRRDPASISGYVSDPRSPRYGQPCPKHERDPFAPHKCWKCGAAMKAPASRGGKR